MDQRTRASADLLPSDRARPLPNEQDRERGQEMKEDTCKKCGVEMWREGRIDDDIKLCHSCYLEIAEKGGNPDEEGK